MSLALPRAIAVLPPDPAAEVRDAVTLGHDERHRRRRIYRGERGYVFLLDLAEARLLREGELLAIEDGGRVRVHAAAEPLLEVRGRDARHLARLAWHLGNRHLATAIEDRRILIRDDHVIERMLIGLGAQLARVEAAFEPEGGAYGEHSRAPAQSHRHA
jgi:urease accessory protein